MSIDFTVAKCQNVCNNKKFGLCDDAPDSPDSQDREKRPAYIDEINGAKWIAVVVNEDRLDVTFTAVDHCIDGIKRDDGKSDKQCDGFLSYDRTVIFVELKERNEPGSKWINEGEKQLRGTIMHFEKSDEAEKYTVKKAYIANNQRPKFRESQAKRMEQFQIETGYVLRIQNRIILE